MGQNTIRWREAVHDLGEREIERERASERARERERTRTRKLNFTRIVVS